MIAVEAPGWQGARREHTRRYVTNEQRRQPGWIGREGERVVLSRALTTRALAAVALATIAGGHAGAETRPPYGGDIVAPLLGEPASLDPVRATAHAEVSVVELVCDTLYRVDASGEAQPRLAAGPPALGDNGLTARIRIREGVRFHDGSTLTASDVIRSLERARRDTRAGWWLAPVKSIAAESGEIVLTLRRSTPELTTLLAAPATAVTPRGAAVTKDELVGTGPFSLRLVDRKRRRIVLDAFEDHHAGRPYVDVVELRWYEAADDEAKAYEAGRTHVSFRGSVAFAGHKPKHDTARVTGPATVLAYIGFGTAHADILAHTGFRRAVSLAIDRDGFTSVGTGEPVSGALQPAAPALGGPSPKSSERVARLQAAKRELATAAREVADLRTSPPALEILVDETRPDDAEIAKKVQAALFRLGLKARTVSVSATRLASRIESGDCDLYIGQLAAPGADPVLEVAAAFAVAGSSWASRYLEKRALTDEAALAEFDEQLPIVPLFHRAIRAHHRKTMGGVSFDVLGRLSLADLFVLP
jgi:ABC-type transport system substrate-binding protein